MEEDRKLARHLANESLSQGRPLQWFEQLYSAAKGNESTIPWADMRPNPNLTEWLDATVRSGTGRRALVVGCGLGDDAELLASLGFRVVAFDISQTCIEWCRRRFPDSSVSYVVADLMVDAHPFEGPFDFVLEAYTLQVLPPDMRKTAIDRMSSLLARNGTLLVITRGRHVDDDEGKMPWPLVREELQTFEVNGLREMRFEDYIEHEEPPVRRFRVEYRRG